MAKQLDIIEPAFEGNDTCIVFCSDNDFMACTSVAIESLIENRNVKKTYDIIIFHKSVNELTQKIIQEMAVSYDNISIRFLNLSDYLTNTNFYTENRNNFTEEAYFRLFIPWVVSDAYKRAIYLDGDMIVRKDINHLFNVNLKGNYIAAVRDYWGICNCYIPGNPLKEYRQSIGITDIDSYIISATILFDLDRFRQHWSLEKIIALASSKEWMQHDQDVINVLCKGKIEYIGPTWGYMSPYGNEHYLPENLQYDLEQVNHDPVIRHYGGVRKPWKNAYTKDGLEFWEYAERTPYFTNLAKRIQSAEYRSYILYQLSNGKLDNVFTPTDVERYYKNVFVSSLSMGHTRYRIISIKNNVLHLEGMVGFFAIPFESNIIVRFRINNDLIEPALQEREDGTHKNVKSITYRGEMFEIDYTLNEDIQHYRIDIVCTVDGVTVEKRNLGFENFSPLYRDNGGGFLWNDGWLINTDTASLNVWRAGRRAALREEKQLYRKLWHGKNPGSKKAIIARILAHIARLFFRKPIWLISDRVSKADDNGEALFRYINQQKSANVSSFFIISKDCPDFQRMKKIGSVIPILSWRHKLLTLVAEFVISTQTDDVYRNPFGRFDKPYKDMLSKVRYVFLQHGVIGTDLSDWLCKRRQNMTGFIVSTEREFRSIIEGNYHYSDQQVWLTGLPRFDYLQNWSQRIITIMPTWRKYLAIRENPETGIWEVKNGFINSNYVSFYRSLLNNARLNEKAAEHGYSIHFKIHPSFGNQYDLFMFDETTHVIDFNESYREIFSKSSLIVTDYSSAVFDFAYLRKPLIYCQFDKAEFFSGEHVCTQGYFDYERDGFGEVEYDLESTVDRIIEYMENGCQLKDKYRERIDNFFAFNDQNNCQRVYEKILSLEQEDPQ